MILGPSRRKRQALTRLDAIEIGKEIDVRMQDLSSSRASKKADRAKMMPPSGIATKASILWSKTIVLMRLS